MECYEKNQECEESCLSFGTRYHRLPHLLLCPYHKCCWVVQKRSWDVIPHCQRNSHQSLHLGPQHCCVRDLQSWFEVGFILWRNVVKVFILIFSFAWILRLMTLPHRLIQAEATHGVTVSMSAFLACHQCYCAGLSLAWGLNPWAVRTFSEARHQGFSLGAPVSSPPS